MGDRRSTYSGEDLKNGKLDATALGSLMMVLISTGLYQWHLNSCVLLAFRVD